jgi:RNA polymerase sigma factor (sigma-70 family)
MANDDHDADVLDLSRSLEEPLAFAAVFDRHFAAIHRYLHRRAGADVADELAAETFLIAFEQRARFGADKGIGARPWLYGIATNLLRGRHRLERRRLLAYARTGVDAATVTDDDATAARLDASRHGPRLAAALARMRTADRDVFLLVALAGLTYAEVAVALEIPSGTVATRVRRARALLTDELSPRPVATETLADV